MCLIKPPEEFANIALTVMCGPFFSMMPFPPEGGLYSLSHVRYTPHRTWIDQTSTSFDRFASFEDLGLRSNFPEMRRDAAKFVPCMANASYVKSMWEVKTVLKESENNDSRPILLRKNHGIRGLHCILGAKIDNYYDMLDAIENQ
jgi:hypothetical protein